MDCLQLALVPFVDQKIDCHKIKTTAFESLPKCYTQPGNSICDVSMWSQVPKIMRVVELKEYLNKESLVQMIQVADICIRQRSGFSLFQNDATDESDAKIYWQRKKTEWEAKLAAIK